MILPSWRDWLFSAKAFTASMLAFYIALAAGQPRPYWAMAAVYIVANPLSGATSSKALYRALGTFIGAAGAVFLLPMFSSAPYLFCLVMSLWTGCFLFTSLLDRTPRSYVFMLAGYTLPLIALPAVLDPSTVFDIAVARSEEITIGIVCAAVVDSLLFPMRIGPVLGGQVRGWLTDVQSWASAILKGENGVAAVQARQHLAADIRNMDMLISQMAYDSAAHSVTRRAKALRGRLAILLPILASLADRLQAVTMAGEEPAGLAAVKADILAWIESGQADTATGDRLRAKLRDLEPDAGQRASWAGLVLSSALERMNDLLSLWQDCWTLQTFISLGERTGRRKPVLLYDRLIGAARHYDFGLLIFSAASVAAGTFASCLVWLGSDWAEGSGCVVMTAVSCSFFAAVDNPAQQIRVFTVWSAIAVAAGAVYLFAILPVTQDFGTLVAVFIIPFLIAGTIVTRPRFYIASLLLIVNTASFMALQSNYTADFASYINGTLPSVIGGIFGLVWTILTRPFGAAFAARRLVRAGWTDLAETARGHANSDPAHFAGRMLDRLGQLVPRLAQGMPEDVAAADVLTDLRIGINILDLRRTAALLPAPVEQRIGLILEGVASVYAQRVKTRKVSPAPDSLVEAIDASFIDLTQLQHDDACRTTLQALVGLRRALFPEAPGPKSLDPPAVAVSLAAE